MGRNNTIDETSEEHQRRLNRERQQRYHRNMDSEGSTGLEKKYLDFRHFNMFRHYGKSSDLVEYISTVEMLKCLLKPYLSTNNSIKV
ncbi:11291_t:CDS:2 [Entrophospora sp. SA101]|nr:11291_t:CDS:2 [Entrophospora sp. SA101]